jgi:hypothetical protein
MDGIETLTHSVGAWAFIREKDPICPNKYAGMTHTTCMEDRLMTFNFRVDIRFASIVLAQALPPIANDIVPTRADTLLAIKR